MSDGNCERCSQSGNPLWERHPEYCHVWQRGAKARIALLEKVCEAVKAVLLRYDIESDELDEALRAAGYLQEPAP